ncbi:Na/Pi cotransporter family protein, partial [Gammaproteobacteria bacterium]|nr:Na/Pi cotransporter family protein [Gammaproteobacteria bacterium]
DTAFELMAHGINLHRTQILESEDLKKTIDEDREIIDFDMDALYENKVKVLYSAIIDFISRSQSSLPSDFAEELYRFRHAAGDIVECVKHIKHFRKNATTYLVSDNEYIRGEYNKIRFRLASILREIYRLRESRETETETETVLELFGLDEFKLEMEQSRNKLNLDIDALLLDQSITPHMATSLLNDYGYAEDTAWNLVNVAHAMLASHDALVAEAEQAVTLDREEIEELARSDAA